MLVSLLLSRTPNGWSRDAKLFPLLTSGDKDAGSMFLYDPKRYPKEHQRYDIDFKKYCCGAVGLCNEYRNRRPSRDSKGYMPPISCKHANIYTINCMHYSISMWIPFAITTYVIPNDNLQHGTGVNLISQHWMEGPTHSMDGESTYCSNTFHQTMELPSVCRCEWSLWTGHLQHSFLP